MVIARRQGYACYLLGMCGEISNIAFVVELKKPQRIVDFGTGIQNLTRVVSEAGEMDTIFLARHRLGLFALLDVENMHGFIIGGAHKELALVVEVKGCYACFG